MGEEFSELPDSESRWTTEGLLDIREDYEKDSGIDVKGEKLIESQPLKLNEAAKPNSVPEGIEEIDSDEDFETQTNRLKATVIPKYQELLDKLKRDNEAAGTSSIGKVSSTDNM